VRVKRRGIKKENQRLTNIYPQQATVGKGGKNDLKAALIGTTVHDEGTLMEKDETSNELKKGVDRGGGTGKKKGYKPPTFS